MKYVYHLKPQNMFGEILFPLNLMKVNFPEVYNFHINKYKGREFIMDSHVPILNCKWNDVIHTSPIDPRIVYKELKQAGLTVNEKSVWIKIPIEKLNESLTVIFKYENEDGEATDNQMIKFSKNSFQNLIELPTGTNKYYKESSENKIRPLLFHLVPHVLTMDKIDISNCETFCLSKEIEFKK